ncbi:MAG: DUF2059 domain-containing protein [Pseudomonadota bacterium]
MTLRILLVATALAVAANVPAYANKQNDPSPAAVDRTRIDLANQILARSYPEETREPMFRAVAEQMEAQMLQTLRGQVDDEGALAIIQAWQDRISEETNLVLKQAIPDLMNSWAISFSEVFSEQELRDILAFVSTDTGQSFMLKSADVVSHPDFAAANQRYMDETMAIVMSRLPDLISELGEYRRLENGASAVETASGDGEY